MAHAFTADPRRKEKSLRKIIIGGAQRFWVVDPHPNGENVQRLFPLRLDRVNGLGVDAKEPFHDVAISRIDLPLTFETRSRLSALVHFCETALAKRLLSSNESEKSFPGQHESLHRFIDKAVIERLPHIELLGFRMLDKFQRIRHGLFIHSDVAWKRLPVVFEASLQ